LKNFILHLQEYLMNAAKFALISSALLFAACGNETPSTSSHGTTHAPAALPANLRLAAAPANAKSVAEAKTALKDGDRVVIQGIVGGRADPIAANRAILTLMDSKLPTCDKSPMDKCPTPWDACCEPADVIAKNSLSIQVADADGHPLQNSLSAIEGVKPLASITITGTARISADGAALINADGIFVGK
jgi:hypothetical protein